MGAGDGPIGTVFCHVLSQGRAGDVPVFTTIPPISSAEPEELEDLASTAKHVLVVGLSHGGYKDSVAQTTSLTLLLFQDNHIQQQNTNAGTP
jgi:formaldehyde-activating enzyme involved in methanogenesis